MQNSPERGGEGLLQRTYSIERLAALSDGVFAIILTLLVLELKIPELEEDLEQVLLADLLAQFPNFVAWIISFILVARFWLVHHTLLQQLGRCTVGTMVANLVLLGLVSLVPFGSALIGTYEFHLVAVALFSFIMALSGISVGLFARHIAINQHLHRAESSSNPVWHWRYHAFGIPLFALIAFALAWIHHPATALGAWAAEPLVALGLTLRRE